MADIYSKSKRMQWDAEQDIDWSLSIDPSKPLIDQAGFAIGKLPFIQRQSAATQEAFRARSTPHGLQRARNSYDPVAFGGWAAMTLYLVRLAA